MYLCNCKGVASINIVTNHIINPGKQRKNNNKYYKSDVTFGLNTYYFPAQLALRRWAHQLYDDQIGVEIWYESTG